MILNRDSSSHCIHEAFVGYAPISYFIIGVSEFIVYFSVLLMLMNRNSFKSFFELTHMTLILPIYLNVVYVIVVFGILSSINHLVGLYPTNLLSNAFLWYIIRSFSEALSIFLTFSGIGWVSIRNSILCGFIWDGLNILVILLVASTFNDGLSFDSTVLAVAMMLTVYYTAMMIAPYKYLHRRPAGKRFAQLSLLVLGSQFAAIAYTFLSSPSISSDRDVSDFSCYAEITFVVTEPIQLAIMMYTFVLDSLFWQGLYSDAATNLNQPLLGLWDMNDQNTLKMVTDSIADLERKVVPILPFSRLQVDCSTFFSGGSARVYRGVYDQIEVAIKFLFCIELTPDRIVEFCQEATLLNTLQHDNIVRCYGVAIMPPAISLVTEFCGNGSLFDFIHTTKASASSLSSSIDNSQHSAGGLYRGDPRHEDPSMMRPLLSADRLNALKRSLNQMDESTAADLEARDSSPFIGSGTSGSSESTDAASSTSMASRLVEAVQASHSIRYSDIGTAQSKVYTTQGGTLSQNNRHYSSSFLSKNRSSSDLRELQQHCGKRSQSTSGQGTLQSATTVLLSRELGYGIGPTPPRSKQSFRHSSSIERVVLSYPSRPSLVMMHGSTSTRHRTGSYLYSKVSSASSQSSFTMTRSSMLSTAHKLKMAKECCAGVAYLHSKNIIHCDIKSLNFLGKADRQGGSVAQSVMDEL